MSIDDLEHFWADAVADSDPKLAKERVQRELIRAYVMRGPATQVGGSSLPGISAQIEKRKNGPR